MDTEQMRVAVAVARYGSFTGAALRLYMAQSTVSRQVAALERDLGVPLFVRGPRRVVPTAAGRGFLIAAQEVLTALERAVDAARRTRSDAQASSSLPLQAAVTDFPTGRTRGRAVSA